MIDPPRYQGVPSKEPKTMLAPPWIKLLHGPEGMDRQNGIAVLSKQISDVSILLNTYVAESDEQVRNGIISVLVGMNSKAIGSLVQQLIDGDPVRQECAHRALPVITESASQLVALMIKKPRLKGIITEILSEQSQRLGYSSLKQFLSKNEYIIRFARTQSLLKKTITQVIFTLNEAKKCLNYKLYAQVIETCDRAVLHVLISLLKSYQIEFDESLNKLEVITTKLCEHRFQLHCEQDVRRLRGRRNDIRYRQKQFDHDEAGKALIIGHTVIKEITRRFKLGNKKIESR